MEAAEAGGGEAASYKFQGDLGEVEKVVSTGLSELLWALNPVPSTAPNVVTTTFWFLPP